MDDIIINAPAVSYTPPVGGTTFGSWAVLATPPIPLRGLWLYPNDYQGNILINLGLGASPSEIYFENIYFNVQSNLPTFIPMKFPKGIPISFQAIQYSSTAEMQVSADMVGGDLSECFEDMSSHGQSVNNAYYGFQPAASTSWQQMGSGLTGESKALMFGVASGSDGAYSSCSIGYGPNSTSVTSLVSPTFGSSSPWQFGYVYIKKKLQSGTLLWLNNNNNGNIVAAGYAFY